MLYFKYSHSSIGTCINKREPGWEAQCHTIERFVYHDDIGSDSCAGSLWAGWETDGNPGPETNTGKNSSTYQHSAIGHDKLFYHNSLLVQPRNDSVAVCCLPYEHLIWIFKKPKPKKLHMRSSEQVKHRKH